jgi:hypothetical protein
MGWPHKVIHFIHESRNSDGADFEVILQMNIICVSHFHIIPNYSISKIHPMYHTKILLWAQKVGGEYDNIHCVTFTFCIVTGFTYVRLQFVFLLQYKHSHFLRDTGMSFRMKLFFQLHFWAIFSL